MSLTKYLSLDRNNISNQEHQRQDARRQRSAS